MSNELDRESLWRVRDEVERRLGAHARRREFKPMFDSMSAGLLSLQASTAELMAPFEAQVRRSVLAVERSVADFPNEQAALVARQQVILNAVRARTGALQEWLESLQ
ncbi:MAG TPA: hypothetical protein VEX38_02935 [Fimbriimonadaceae bacterium]|nr:hypothetical protein [Fimbriimonadaceae bacterium]